MLKITEDKNISISRGDSYTLQFSAFNEETQQNYEFQINDVVTFRILKVNGYHQEVLKEKNITIDEPKEIVDIPIIPTDTTDITDQVNQPVKFWYEIALNETDTIIGYDDITGPAIFEVLPAKD